MGKMSTHDNMMAVYRNLPVEEFPVAIYNRYLPRGAKEKEYRQLGLSIIQYHPVTTLLAPPWHLNPGFLSEVKGADFKIAHHWENDEIIETRTYETKVGTVRQHTKKDPVYGSDWIEKYYITKPEDYKVMEYIVNNTVFKSNANTTKRMMEELAGDGVVLGRIDRSPFQKLLVELAGPERFLLDISSGVKEAESLLEAMFSKMEEVFPHIAECPAEVIWQPENVTGEMTPPPFFKKYCMGYYEKLGQVSKQAGKPYVVHLDGRLKSLGELIKDCPFDCIESFSYPEVGNDLSFSEARALWPDKVIIPNFPSSLCSESDDKIKSYLKEKMAEAGFDKPYMMQISEDIPHGQWQRVIPLLIECVKRLTKGE